MKTLEEIKKTRLEKLKSLNQAGFSGYPSKTKRTHPVGKAVEDFEELVDSKKKIILAGRIRSLRTHGKLTFLDIEDGSGKIQGLLRENNLGEKGYQFFLDHFDIGDFAELQGTLFETKTKEKTLDVTNFRVLAKSLRPLPEKWHGLQDVEERYRKRYLDLLMNPEVKEVFQKKSQLAKLLREYLDQKGFVEVKTPTLQPIYGGATAQPFVTHHNALDINLYLRVSDELYLKRLIAGGFEKVYEMATDFRNEGIDRWHNPEFTMLEFYWAYADYKDLMKMTEEMLSGIVEKLTGSRRIKYGKDEIDFIPPWPRVPYLEAFHQATGINLPDVTFESLKKLAEKKKLGVDLRGIFDLPTLVDHIYKTLIRTKIVNPTFLIDHPYSMRPLAKKKEDESLVESFHLICGGVELVNAYSELNDPQDQRSRWQEEMQRGKSGASEYQVLDEDYIEALEYGMPPTAGWGMGIDRFCALLTDQHSIKDTILFPTMRPR
ncbi:MAG: lysine--tRNA ligase [Candidatus Nealsonbacteria bacterium]|nr:lysine--tRNA ligase [Candidatus Nealsonbacteria bacterium]